MASGLPNNSYKPITNTAWVRAWLCKLQKECTRLAAASHKVYQLLAHGRWLNLKYLFVFTTKRNRYEMHTCVLFLNIIWTNINYKNISFFFQCAWLCKLQKECTRLAAASHKVYQLLAHGRWFSPGIPVSDTNCSDHLIV
jgi:hypothetical protein